jgi:hypothetical protein
MNKLVFFEDWEIGLLQKMIEDNISSTEKKPEPKNIGYAIYLDELKKLRGKLDENKYLNIESIIELYINIKTGEDVSAVDVFPIDIMNTIWTLEENVDKYIDLKKYL